MARKHYFVYLLASSAILLLVVAAMNYVVDPFAVFRAVEIKGFNTLKPAVRIDDSRDKLQSVQRIRPKSIVLGNSRTELGINPDNPNWITARKPTYNLSLVSGNMSVLKKYFQSAHKIQPVEALLLGVDLIMFKETPDDPKSLARLEMHQKNVRPANSSELLYNLLSLDALKASIMTMFNQQIQIEQAYLFNGQRSEKMLQQHLDSMGQRGMFQAQERKFISSDYYSLNENGRYLYNDSGVSTNLQAFESLVKFCAENRISTKIFINPVHARQLELIYQKKLWSVFEDWKRQLVRYVAAATSNEQQAGLIELWDFSGYNDITMEPIPDSSENGKRMKWYWESSHYTEETSNVMLKTMFGLNVDYQGKKFGERITQQNIDEHLQNTRQDRMIFFKNHYQDVNEIRVLVKKISDRSRK